MKKVEPLPSTDLSSIVPPIFSMFERTTSMPTPRPDTLVTFSAVDRPALKMSCWICCSDMLATSASVARPLAIAFARILSTDRPRPSSLISMMMWPPSWKAFSRTVPNSGLPAAARSCGFSIP